MQDIKFLIILLLSTALILSFSWKNNIIFTDEILFEEAAYKMATQGNYLIPQLNGKTWLEKPPLYFWVTATLYQIFPPTPLTRRLFTLAAALATVILTYKLALFFFNKRLARWSMLVLSTTPLFLYFSKTANLDIPLTFFITAALYFYLKAKSKIQWLFASGFFLGLAFLTRSFLSLTPFLVIALDQLFLKKNRLPLRYLLLAFLLALLIVLPWHCYAWKTFPDLFIQEYLSFNLKLHLFYQTPGHQPLSIPQFLFNVLFKFNPLAIFVLVNFFKKYSIFPKFLLLWIISSLVPLTLAATRHEWYAMQSLPPIAILSSQGMLTSYAYFKSKLKPLQIELLTIFTASFLLAIPIGVFLSIPKETEVVTVLKKFIASTPAAEPLYNLDYQYVPDTTLYNPRQSPVITKDQLQELDHQIYLYLDSEDQYRGLLNDPEKCCQHQVFIRGEKALVVKIIPK